MNVSALERARLAELLVVEALEPLGSEERLELERLRASHPDLDDGGIEAAVALLTAAALGPLQPLPERLRILVATQAEEHFGPRLDRSVPLDAAARVPVTDARLAREARPQVDRTGWYAAAACAVLALGLWVSGPDAPRDAPVAASTPEPGAPDEDPTADSTTTSSTLGASSPSRPIGDPTTVAREPPDEVDDSAADGRADLLAARRFVLRRNWAAGGDPTGSGVQGDVVWDAASQTGYMRFVGLRRNDPAFEQYQLWIFDAARDERYPVDGGVFDVRGDGELVVPIRAALTVNRPRLFAITLERPGGVVVSDRSRVVVVART